MLEDGGTQPTAYYTDPAKAAEVTQNTLLMISLIIGDAMIVRSGFFFSAGQVVKCGLRMLV